MVFVECPQCHGTPYGHPKGWPDFICVCGICEGEKLIAIGFVDYIRYIRSGKVPVSAITKVIHEQVKNELPVYR